MPPVKSILILLLLFAGSLMVKADETPPPTEITLGMGFETAAAALRAAGAHEGYLFDIDWLKSPPKCEGFKLPDGRVITLHAAPSELFPSVFRVTAIFIVHPNAEDLAKSNLKGHRKIEQVEKFAIPAAATPQKSK